MSETVTVREHMVMEAIRDAERCEDYCGPFQHGCDGLDGCELCLTLAARAAIDAAKAKP